MSPALRNLLVATALVVAGGVVYTLDANSTAAGLNADCAKRVAYTTERIGPRLRALAADAGVTFGRHGQFARKAWLCPVDGGADEVVMPSLKNAQRRVVANDEDDTLADLVRVRRVVTCNAAQTALGFDACATGGPMQVWPMPVTADRPECCAAGLMCRFKNPDGGPGLPARDRDIGPCSERRAPVADCFPLPLDPESRCALVSGESDDLDSIGGAYP